MWLVLLGFGGIVAAEVFENEGINLTERDYAQLVVAFVLVVIGLFMWYKDPSDR